MKILFVEDDDDKAKDIETFVASEFSGTVIMRARSFDSGLRLAMAHAQDFSLILLDMTMPNFDRVLGETPASSAEHFAGRDFLAQIKLRNIFIPTIVVTMFDSFGVDPKKLSLDKLASELASEYSPPFRGVVYYNAKQSGWKGSLKSLVENVLSGSRK